MDDLQKAGIGIIQIDEPALREGLPLRRNEWGLTSNGRLMLSSLVLRLLMMTRKFTLICAIAEFNDIMDSIAALDADVITIETSRSDMDLLDAFEDFDYQMKLDPVFMIFTHQMYRMWNGLLRY